ncbi:MAG: hypothetical protein R3D31_16905 [Hyphomicrobiaceae bacterium]
MNAIFRHARRALAGLLVLLALAAAGPEPVRAAEVPSKRLIDIYVKSTLLAFNDANITGNYSVFWARLSKVFRDQYPVERFKEIFKAFHDQKIDIGPIVVEDVVLTTPPSIGADGVLAVIGVFETRPSRVYFDLGYIRSDGDWRLIHINVNVKPAEAQGDVPPARQTRDR